MWIEHGVQEQEKFEKMPIFPMALLSKSISVSFHILSSQNSWEHGTFLNENSFKKEQGRQDKAGDLAHILQ